MFDVQVVRSPAPPNLSGGAADGALLTVNPLIVQGILWRASTAGLLGRGGPLIASIDPSDAASDGIYSDASGCGGVGKRVLVAILPRG